MKNLLFIYFKDIRFWIVLFFVLRLTGITNPPLEVAHNWRQTTVTMVARNFLEVDNSIFYPRIDIAGEKLGITPMEFPLLNYLIYLIAQVFGYEHWYGRLINLIVSSLGLWYFYKLIRKFFSEPQAFFAAFILLFSIWFSYSRKVMPDTFSTSLIIMGLYYGCSYLINQSRPWWNLLLYASLICLGALSKLPSGYLLIVLIIPFIRSRITLVNKLYFLLATLIALTPVYWWYFYWLPKLEEAFDFTHFFMGGDMSEGFRQITAHLQLTLSRFYDDALKYIGFLVFLCSLILAFIKKDKLITAIFALTTAAFSLVILKSGFTFSKHSYYVIPFVPVMAMIGGYGLNKLPSRKLAITLLALIAIEGVGNQINDFFISPKRLELLKLEDELDNIGSESDLILINSGEYPTPMYFAHRKGWVLDNDEINPQKIEELRQKGLKYIVIMKTYFGTGLQLELKKVAEAEEFVIYRV